MRALEIVKYAYLATLICVIIVEVFPNWRIARPSALAAIVLVTIGGSAWAYAAYHTPGAWPEFEYEKTAKADGQSSRSSGRSPPSDGGGDPQDAAGAEPGDGGIEPNGSGGSGASSASAQVASAGAAAGEAAQSATRRLAESLGLAQIPQPEPRGGDTVQDCSDCPPMVIVPPGSARIGAEDGDALATLAERPARNVRVWPGYAIGKSVITPASYRRFLDETRRQAQVCSGAVAAAGDGSSSLINDRADAMPCLSAPEAEAYVVWLSNRTGKTYRLPTAIEWEYAMRMLGDDVLSRGEAAEFVADCWQDHLPREGFEILSPQGPAIDCGMRMLKGAKQYDAARWQRLSARRPIAASAAPSGVSFRIVRDLLR